MNPSKLFPAWICALLCLAMPSTTEAARATWDPVDVDLMELVAVDYQQGKKLPKRIRKLDGEEVRLEGYMSIDTQEGDTQFYLTFDSCGCNAAKVNHYIVVTLTDDITRYTPGKIQIEGTLSVGEKLDEFGFVESIYRLESESYDI